MVFKLGRFIASVCLALGMASAQPVHQRVDFSRANGSFRPLHGINKGPIAAGGLIDVTAGQRALNVPVTRLHDCHWPNPDVVDIHAIFPDRNANPLAARSYDFQLTDEYINAVRQTGAQIVYRLGESIEHTTVKRFVHPPRDFEKWAEICVGIIHHYNDGWANGFHHGIRYWEIWNEPENRPAMWSGTDEDYFRLYETAARVIKSKCPKVRVGGPAVGYSGRFVDGAFIPSSFVTNFLARCRRESLPLDFFSWHCYTDDPAELVIRSKALRRLLDASGFPAAESHLNEWNYLPGRTWEPLSKSASPSVRQEYYAQMAGAPGAAFIAAALIRLQDAPVDMCNLFHGELGGFGLFNEHGMPQRNYDALRAFVELLKCPRRVALAEAPLTLAAGIDERNQHAAILISNLKSTPASLDLELGNLPTGKAWNYEVYRIDDTAAFEATGGGVLPGKARLPLDVKGPVVLLIKLAAM